MVETQYWMLESQNWLVETQSWIVETVLDGGDMNFTCQAIELTWSSMVTDMIWVICLYALLGPRKGSFDHGHNSNTRK